MSNAVWVVEIYQRVGKAGWVTHKTHEWWTRSSARAFLQTERSMFPYSKFRIRRYIPEASNDK